MQLKKLWNASKLELDNNGAVLAATANQLESARITLANTKVTLDSSKAQLDETAITLTNSKNNWTILKLH